MTANRNYTWRRNAVQSLKWMRQNLLLILTITAVVVGLIIGLSLRGLDPSLRVIKLIGFPGELFMRMLKCVVIPLIVASLITGVANLSLKESGRIGCLAVLYYLTTTLIAVATGIVLVIAIHPGDPNSIDSGIKVKQNSSHPSSTVDTMLDLLRNLFPDNLVGSAFQQQQTGYYCMIDGKKVTNGALCQGAIDQNWTDMRKDNFIRTELLTKPGSSNILGIIACSIAVGIVLSQMGEKARTMVDLFVIMDQISMKIINWVMWYSPVGIASLIASKALEVDDLLSTLERLGMFCATVLTGLAIHFTITLPLIYFVTTGRNPLTFVKGMLQAMTFAFGTASSAATLPTTFRCLEQNLGIDRRVTRFVLPVGATINMDGSAMYEAVATLFIAQMVGRTLNVGQVIMISLTSTLASVGAAAIPSGALVTMIMVLTAADLPVEYISLILAVDWLLDRFRTAINVLGDAYGAAIVYYYSRRHLAEQDSEKQISTAKVIGNSDEKGRPKNGEVKREEEKGGSEMKSTTNNGEVKMKASNGTAISGSEMKATTKTNNGEVKKIESNGTHHPLVVVSKNSGKDSPAQRYESDENTSEAQPLVPKQGNRDQ